MRHPLLTKELAEAAHTGQAHWTMEGTALPCTPDDCPFYSETRELIERIPPDRADRLERALDVCAVCGLERVAYTRDRQAWTRGEHEDWAGHPYQPLVVV